MTPRTYDFSDYLELRRARDLGRAKPGSDGVLEALERELGIGFARSIPSWPALLVGPGPHPRGLAAEHIRVVFEMREEVAGLGRVRAGLHGFDFPDGESSKDYLDFLEEERRTLMEARKLLRVLDRKIWAIYTGDRRMPETTLG